MTDKKDKFIERVQQVEKLKSRAVVETDKLPEQVGSMNGFNPELNEDVNILLNDFFGDPEQGK